MRRYAELGIQFVVTLIDSELPKTAEDAPVFGDQETALRLHDERPDGRLFRMPSGRPRHDELTPTFARCPAGHPDVVAGKPANWTAAARLIAQLPHDVRI